MCQQDGIQKIDGWVWVLSVATRPPQRAHARACARREGVRAEGEEERAAAFVGQRWRTTQTRWCTPSCAHATRAPAARGAPRAAARAAAATAEATATARATARWEAGAGARARVRGCARVRAGAWGRPYEGARGRVHVTLASGWPVLVSRNACHCSHGRKSLTCPPAPPCSCGDVVVAQGGLHTGGTLQLRA